MLKLTEDKVDNFNKEGYIHLKNVIPSELLVKARSLAIELKHQYKSRVGEPRHNGSGNFWNGLELASTLNPNLWECYTADFMFEIASKFLGSKPYLFNDQVVVKLPKEDFSFEPHYDDQFGPGIPGLKTINCSWILTNMPEETGPLWCQDSFGHYEMLTAKAGDIVIIDGQTLHYSGLNKTDRVRALYACVYSNKPIGNFQKGYYNEQFTNA